MRFEVIAEEPLAETHAEPLGVDLRKERFARARLRLAAGLMGISLDSLWQREKRRSAKRRAIAGLATLLMAAVTVILSAQWLMERDRVRIQASIALARQLAAQSEKFRGTSMESLETSALLAIESLRQPTMEGDQAVRHALSLLARPVESKHYDRGEQRVTLSRTEGSLQP